MYYTCTIACMYINSMPPPPLGLILLSLCSSLPSPADSPQLFLFALPHSLLHHGPAGQPQLTVCLLSEGIHTDTERGLGRQHPTDLSLVLGGNLTDQGGVVDEAVLWSVVFGLQCSACQERGTGIITVRFTQAKHILMHSVKDANYNCKSMVHLKKRMLQENAFLHRAIVYCHIC